MANISFWAGRGPSKNGKRSQPHTISTAISAESTGVEKLTQTLGYNAALGAWINDPIVIFESVYRLENGANTSHIAIDLCIAEKFGGQIGI